MTSIDLEISRLRPGARLPRYMTEHAAGMDLFACLEEPMTFLPGERGVVPTGIAVAIPPGFEGQVRARSGLALRQGLALVNAPGTIDADYRGEVGVLVINLGQESITLSDGDRIAQLVIAPVVRADLIERERLATTVRNEGGFGHTGVGHDTGEES